MSELSKTLGTQAVKLKVGENTYSLAPFTLGDYGQFESYLEDNAWAAIRRANKRRWVTDEEDDKNRRALVAMIASNQLAYASEAFAAASQTVQGVERLLRISLATTHPELDEEAVHKLITTDLQACAKAVHENDLISQ